MTILLIGLWSQLLLSCFEGMLCNDLLSLLDEELRTLTTAKV